MFLYIRINTKTSRDKNRIRSDSLNKTKCKQKYKTNLLSIHPADMAGNSTVLKMVSKIFLLFR